MTFTAASHQGAIDIIWELSCRPSLFTVCDESDFQLLDHKSNLLIKFNFDQIEIVLKLT